MHRAINSSERMYIILKALSKKKTLSTNDVIDEFHKSNTKKFMKLPELKKIYFLKHISDPNVYTHINKETNILERKGLIEVVGVQIGKKKRKEKVYQLTPAGVKSLAELPFKQLRFMPTK